MLMMMVVMVTQSEADLQEMDAFYPDRGRLVQIDGLHSVVTRQSTTCGSSLEDSNQSIIVYRYLQ
jgi:hypothetical protein